VFKFKIISKIVLLLFTVQCLARAQAPLVLQEGGKYFDRVIFVVFENTDYSKALKQPFFKQLANSGAHFSNFMAMTHPSQANYIGLTSGSLNNVKGDELVDLNVPNIVDLLEAKGLTWTVYAEDFPGHCFSGSQNADYVRKHNPFISYLNIQKNALRCANIHNANQFEQDAKRGILSNYIFYIPNLKNDGHDTNISFADKWYEEKFSMYLNEPLFMSKTILISTFDESGSFFGKNQIYTSIVGPDVKPGIYSDALNLYSLLKLVEDNWDLGNLGKKDASASPIPNIWN